MINITCTAGLSAPGDDAYTRVFKLLFVHTEHSKHESQNKRTVSKEVSRQHTSSSHRQLESQCVLQLSSPSFLPYFLYSHSLLPSRCQPLASQLETLLRTLRPPRAVMALRTAEAGAAAEIRYLVPAIRTGAAQLGKLVLNSLFLSCC
jgi:hypothetical protein